MKNTMAVVFCCAMAMASTVAGQDAPAKPEPLRSLFLQVALTVEPDGSVSRFEVEPNDIALVRDLLVKRGPMLKFKPPQWHGKAVQLETQVVARVDVVPTTAGGYATRLANFRTQLFFDPPRVNYPRSAAQAERVGWFQYAATLNPDGTVSELRLLVRDSLDELDAALDKAARGGLMKARLRPARVDGAPIGCVGVVSMSFVVPGAPPLPMPAQIAFEHPDKCPEAQLDAGPEGVLL